MKKVGIGIALLLVAAGGVFLVASQAPLPKPQIASLAGQPVPGFTLKDQDGRDFRLADLQGHRVLLFFYRGYW